MSTHFEVKVRYEKLMQDGKVKKVNEPYLIDAVSFSDAEKRINEELEHFINGDFFLNGMKIVNYSDILPGKENSIWFKCKITYISIDEAKGIERKSSSYMLVQANDVTEAKEVIDNVMEGCVSDYTIPSISETKIQDVFEYNHENEQARLD